MSLSSQLLLRSESQCELCRSNEELFPYTVPPRSDEDPQNQIAVCSVCLHQIENPEQLDSNHWRCLNESIWSEIPAVKVVAYRFLNLLIEYDWAQDLRNMMYLDEATMHWAISANPDTIPHKDSNGNILENGDTVTLIKDLNVKGANFTAKRGTAVRRIRLVHNNPEQIEGKVDGQQIVILTQYVKKS